MSIPKETTLKQRLEFYKYALNQIKISGYKHAVYLCHEADDYFFSGKGCYDIGISDLKRLFPEVCEHSNSIEDNVLLFMKTEDKTSNEYRVEALGKAIVDVKRKMKLS